MTFKYMCTLFVFLCCQRLELPSASGKYKCLHDFAFNVKVHWNADENHITSFRNEYVVVSRKVRLESQ